MTAVRTLLAAGLLALGVAACGTSGPSCKQVMISQLTYEFAHPDAKAAGEPSACSGVPKSTLIQYATEALQQYARNGQ